MEKEQSYAIVRTGGKQYKAVLGEKILVDAPAPGKTGLPKVGGALVLSDVLMVSRGGGSEISIGNPLVKGIKVKTKVTAVKKGPKVVIFKKRRRQRYQKSQGYRGQLVELLVEEIAG